MRFKKLSEWLTWQETLHPRKIDLGLDRVACVWEKFHSQSYQPTVITIGGTNGKGSTQGLLELIYLTEGYCVGAYSSPHLLRYNERIQIKGKDVSDEALCSAFDKIDQLRGDVSLTYFEFSTLAALLLFQESNLEIILLEVGLGGRLDAVNIVDSDCAILTSVALDHCNWLGDSREKIGYEKSGIFRKNKPAICVDFDPPQTVYTQAETIGANLHCLDRDIKIAATGEGWDCLLANYDEAFQNYSLPYPLMRGSEQLANSAAAIAACALLRQKLPVQRSSIRRALQSFKLSGRFEIINKKCRWVLDVAHNPAAVEVLVNNLKRLKAASQTIGTQKSKTFAIFAAMADKDVSAMLIAMQDFIQQWFIVDLDNKKAESIERVMHYCEASMLHNPVIECNSVELAVKQVNEIAKTDDLIVVFGSFLTVGQAYEALNKIE